MKKIKMFKKILLTGLLILVFALIGVMYSKYNFYKDLKEKNSGYDVRLTLMENYCELNQTVPGVCNFINTGIIPDYQNAKKSEIDLIIESFSNNWEYVPDEPIPHQTLMDEIKINWTGIKRVNDKFTGDCEDYALSLMQMLIGLRLVNPENILVVFGKAHPTKVDEDDSHVWLEIRLDNTVYICDNNTKRLIPRLELFGEYMPHKGEVVFERKGKEHVYDKWSSISSLDTIINK